MHNVHRQLQSQNLGTFSVNHKGPLQETDLNEIIGKLQSAASLLLHSNGDNGVNVTLSKKDLKILADSALMVDALLGLVRSALYAIPDGGTLTLSTTQLDFRYQYGLDDSTSLAGTARAPLLPSQVRAEALMRGGRGAKALSHCLQGKQARVRMLNFPRLTALSSSTMEV